jgi:hypothetical protein
MVTLVTLITHTEQRSIPAKNRVRKHWTHFLDRLLIWLVEPIPFPGQWPDVDYQKDRYNKIEETTAHERPAAGPRCPIGSRAR